MKDEMDSLGERRRCSLGEAQLFDNEHLPAQSVAGRLSASTKLSTKLSNLAEVTFWRILAAQPHLLEANGWRANPHSHSKQILFVWIQVWRTNRSN